MNEMNRMDNLDAAMAHVADSIEPTIHRSTGATDDDPIQQVLIRAPKSSHARWKDAAARLGVSLAQYVRDLCDAKAAELLDCVHPQSAIRINRWGHFCGTCGQQITRRR